MIINTSTGRREVANQRTETVRTILTSNQQSYEHAVVFCNGVPLSEADLDRTPEELGANADVRISVVVKADAARG